MIDDGLLVVLAVLVLAALFVARAIIRLIERSLPSDTICPGCGGYLPRGSDTCKTYLCLKKPATPLRHKAPG